MKKKTIAAAITGVAAGVLISPPAVQAAINYFDVTKSVSGSGTVYCPTGWKLTGGGVKTLPNNYYGSSYSNEYFLTGSYPNTTRSWKATAKRVHGTYSSSNGWSFSTYSYTPTAYVTCAN